MVHKRMSSVAIFFALLLALLPAAQAQQCLPPDSLSIAEIGGRFPGSDGKIHVTVQFVDANGNATTPPDALSLGARWAMDDWNRHSNTTGVVFEMAPPGATGDIQIMPTSDGSLSGNCAAMQINTGRLYYSSGFESRFEVTSVFAHEFGHYLGLNDAGPNPASPTIMNNPPPPDPLLPINQYCRSAGIATKEVQATDASTVGGAGGCIAQSQSTYNPFPIIVGGFNPYTEPIYYPQPYYSAPCYNYYEVTDFYTCVGGRDGGWDCEYQGSDYTLLFSTC